MFAGFCCIELQKTRVSHRDSLCAGLSIYALKSLNARPDPISTAPDPGHAATGATPATGVVAAGDGGEDIAGVGEGLS